MKILLPLLLLSLPSFAAVPVSDCFTTDGHSPGFNRSGEEILDGQWLITVDLKQASKDDLVWLLGEVAHGNLRAERYPIVFGADSAVFVTEAQDDGSVPLQRPQLIERVNRQLGGIAARNGVVAVSCNGISHPAR